MSRDIKFRAWHEGLNRMFDADFINFEGECYDEINVCAGTYYEKDSRYKLMQYTGLKDKNDKEIYEGDIINIINNSVDEEDGYFIVKYDVETARYILSGNSLLYDFDNTYTNECEVIGNIYENPNLLKEA